MYRYSSKCLWCTEFTSNSCFLSERSIKSLFICVRKCSLYPDKNSRENVNPSDIGSVFPPVYNASQVESGLYNSWEREGLFKPSSSPAVSKIFSMVLPPPNVTGTLHLGHALTVTVQDVLARWHRMRGHRVCWVPGIDHAGIATQVAVEKKLWREKGLTRHDIGRQQFEKEVWKWKEEKAHEIGQQLRKLGASLDWSRHVFTMDPAQSSAVVEAFIRLYEDGLIYRANSLVNWSCVLQSAISDIEVTHQEVKGHSMLNIPGYNDPVEFGILTDVAYKIHNSDSEIVVSTTRIETIPGDVAVAVHPDDGRYKKWHGATVWHPFRQEPIPVICDEFVDPNFGTGAVKITPAHNSVDYEVAKRHNLKKISIISEDGTLNSSAGPYSGMKRFDARQAITNDLRRLDLLRGRKEHTTTVPICSRSGDAIEYLLKSQWFVNCQELGKQAATFVRNGDLKIQPSSFEKVWFTWLDNIKDWCISRQLWWGHQVPMYQCRNRLADTGPSVWVAARSKEEAQRKTCRPLGLADGEEELVETIQDTDVLDTWFSSALFPFSAHGWPSETQDLTRFYPLSVMETGHDILFFWVARMVMLGTHCTGTLPFKKVLLHGIICDALGRKMSKSLGNVIDPGDVIDGITAKGLAEKVERSYEAGLISQTELTKAITSQKKLFPDGIPECGTDALRFTLCSQDVTNFFINFDVSRCVTNRAFCNKVWQACRFVERCVTRAAPQFGEASRADRWILSRLAYLVTELDRALTASELHCATAALRTFLYDEFCDIYLETTKPVINSGTSGAAMASWTLLQCALTTLRALSPFMPFMAEELYRRCVQLEGRHLEKSITTATYPIPEEWDQYRDEALEREFSAAYSIVLAIRRLQSMYNIKGKLLTVHVVHNSAAQCTLTRLYGDVIATLSRCGKLTVVQQVPNSLEGEALSTSAGADCSVYVSVESKDTRVEHNQMHKRYNALSRELAKLVKMTSHEGYKTGAPPQVQDAHIKRIQSLKAELEKLRKHEDSLKEFNEVNTKTAQTKEV